jgi:hypothetical protein
MPDYREISALAKDPAKARGLARLLATLDDVAWTDWEIDLLDSLQNIDRELTTRQSEKLVELRDASLRVATIDGFNLRALVHACWLARQELEDDDQAFVERMRASDASMLRWRDGARVMRIARQLAIVEPLAA